MVLKRKLPSTLKNKPANKPADSSSFEKTDSAGGIAVSAPVSERSREVRPNVDKPENISSNPFMAQQAAHVDASAAKSKSPSTAPITPPAAVKDPFSAPLPPTPATKADSSVIPSDKKNSNDIPDPFATPFGAEATPVTNSASWADEPTDTRENTEKVDVAAMNSNAPVLETSSMDMQEDSKQAPKDIEKDVKQLPTNTGPEIKTVALGALATILIVFVGYKLFFAEKDQTAEVVSRWTGALQDVSEALPEEVPVEGETTPENNGKAVAVLQPETVVAAEDVEEKLTETDEDVFLVEERIFNDTNDANNNEATMEEVSSESDMNAIVEFVDVPEDEVDAPIVSTEETEEMPEDIGIIAKMQQEIVKAREERDGIARPQVEPVEADEQPNVPQTSSEELSLQLEEELAEYRRILAGGNLSGEIISPEEFFGGKDPNTAAQAEKEVLTGERLPRPERQGRVNSQEEAMARYGDNPYNLPVVPAPGKGQETVRTLADFDMAMFEAPTARVRMPKSIRPTLRATAFPPIILLSIVPDQGVIAEVDKRQGVLMIGEAVDGWELIGTHAEYAEFKKGTKTHVLTLGH